MLTTADGIEDLAARVDAGEALEFASLHEEVERTFDRDPDPEYAGFDDEALVQNFLVQSSEINAAMCRWLLTLAEIIRRKVWARDGAKTPTEWLSYYVSMAPSTARERIRVATRLAYFPQTTEGFATGEISYSKVRAITRTGRPELERVMLRYAERATGAQLERILRGFRWARGSQERRGIDPYELQDAEFVEREDGTGEIRIRLPEEQALTAWAQLGHRAEVLFTEAKEGRDPSDPDVPDLPSRRKLKAEAFLQAADQLADKRPDSSGLDRHTLVLHADASTLESVEDGAEPQVPVRASSSERRQRAMSIRMLRRLACDARLAVVAHDEDGNVVSASGSTRRVPARLRRMLYARDGGCRFPGCSSSRGLEAHHIIFWSDGGPTILSNLVLLCRYHHTFVHDKHWTVHHDGHGNFAFQPPDGEILPPVKRLPAADPLRVYSHEGWEDMEFEPGGLRSGWNGQRPDIAYCVAGLFDALYNLGLADADGEPIPRNLEDTAVAA